MEIKDRIKIIRGDLSQQEFADKLGTNRANIAKYETGINKPTSSIISLICKEFNVNEEWLRAGEGIPFKEISKDEQLQEFIDSINIDDGSFKSKLFAILSRFEDGDWKALEIVIDKIIKENVSSQVTVNVTVD